MVQENLYNQLWSCLRITPCSRVSVNNDKTEAFWIGSLAGSLPICPEHSLKWAISKVRALGIWFCIDRSETVAINYEEKKIGCERSLFCSKICGTNAICERRIREPVVSWAPLTSEKRDCKVWTPGTLVTECFDWSVYEAMTHNCHQRWSTTLRVLDDDNSAKWKCFCHDALEFQGGKLLFYFNLKKNDLVNFNTADFFLMRFYNVGVK